MTLTFTFSKYECFEKSLTEIEAYIMSHTAIQKPIRIMFSLLEAVNNAFEHGIKCNEQLHIKLTIASEKDYIKIQIFHNGAGFNYEEKLTPLYDPDDYLLRNITKTRGRGLAIIKKCTDIMQYSDGGRKLQLLFLKGGNND